MQKGLRELDDQIKEARVMVREERVNYDLKKSEIEAHLTALQVTFLFLLSPLNVACMFTFDIYLNECHIEK